MVMIPGMLDSICSSEEKIASNEEIATSQSPNARRIGSHTNIHALLIKPETPHAPKAGAARTEAPKVLWVLGFRVYDKDKNVSGTRCGRFVGAVDCSRNGFGPKDE